MLLHVSLKDGVLVDRIAEYQASRYPKGGGFGAKAHGKPWTRTVIAEDTHAREEFVETSTIARRPWSDSETAKLVLLSDGKVITKEFLAMLAEEFDRTPEAINTRIVVLKNAGKIRREKKTTRWSSDEDALLRKYTQGRVLDKQYLASLSKKLGRTEHAIRVRAGRLNRR